MHAAPLLCNYDLIVMQGFLARKVCPVLHFNNIDLDRLFITKFDDDIKLYCFTVEINFRKAQILYIN